MMNWSNSVFKKWCELVGLENKTWQVDGFDWCHKLESGDQSIHGGIICDEMGLGKTILMLGCLVINEKPSNLIVVPPALLEQWSKCIEKYNFGYRVFVYHGATVRNTKLADLKKEHIVLTTYGMVSCRRKSGYESMLWKVHWDRIIFDEAHHLRNPKTNICLGAARLVADFKWMVTGTPIQNSIRDIKTLFAHLGHCVRGSIELKQLIKQYVLKRTKKTVGIKLPPVDNTNVLVKWESAAEKRLAASIHSLLQFTGVTVDNVDKIIDYLDKTPLPNMVRARQVCVYPRLMVQHLLRLKMDGVVPFDTNICDIKTTSKLSAVVKKVSEQPPSQRKIIFSHYRAEIDALAEMLRNMGYSVAILDGRTKKQERTCIFQPLISETLFSEIMPQKNNGIYDYICSFLTPDVLIAQIQSASEGLNLQKFSQVYFTSPHWNPAVESQAIARTHRIGQTKPVKVFHFQMEPFGDDMITLDNYCAEVQDRKRDIMKIID